MPVEKLSSEKNLTSEEARSENNGAYTDYQPGAEMDIPEMKRAASSQIG
jgi:hypothetical protein